MILTGICPDCKSKISIEVTLNRIPCCDVICPKCGRIGSIQDNFEEVDDEENYYIEWGIA